MLSNTTILYLMFGTVLIVAMLVTYWDFQYLNIEHNIQQYLLMSGNHMQWDTKYKPLIEIQLQPNSSEPVRNLDDESSGSQEVQSTTPNKTSPSLNQYTIYMESKGRLVNIMFCVASAISIARANKRHLVVDERTDEVMTESFRTNMDSYYSVGKSPNGTMLYQESGMFTYETHYIFNLPRQNLQLDGFFQSWRYFTNMSAEVKHIFTQFHSEHTQAAESFMHSLKNSISTENTTFIGVHVRRSDYAGTKKPVRNPGLVYITNAMTTFRKRHGSVHFIVCSDDRKWCIDNLTPLPNVTVSPPGVKEIDLAILTMCDHTIMTMGTFGWWAAYIVGGEAVRPDSIYTKRKYNWNELMMHNFYLPHWFVVENPV